MASLYNHANTSELESKLKDGLKTAGYNVAGIEDYSWYKVFKEGTFTAHEALFFYRRRSVGR